MKNFMIKILTKLFEKLLRWGVKTDER